MAELLDDDARKIAEDIIREEFCYRAGLLQRALATIDAARAEAEKLRAALGTIRSAADTRAKAWGTDSYRSPERTHAKPRADEARAICNIIDTQISAINPEEAE